MDQHRGVRARKRPYFRHGPVVQRPSIRPCQGRDRRFESGRDRGVEPEDAARRAARPLRTSTSVNEPLSIRIREQIAHVIRHWTSGDASGHVDAKSVRHLSRPEDPPLLGKLLDTRELRAEIRKLRSVLLLLERAPGEGLHRYSLVRDLRS